MYSSEALHHLDHQRGIQGLHRIDVGIEAVGEHPRGVAGDVARQVVRPGRSPGTAGRTCAGPRLPCSPMVMVRWVGTDRFLLLPSSAPWPSPGRLTRGWRAVAQPAGRRRPRARCRWSRPCAAGPRSSSDICRSWSVQSARDVRQRSCRLPAGPYDGPMRSRLLGGRRGGMDRRLHRPRLHHLRPCALVRRGSRVCRPTGLVRRGQGYRRPGPASTPDRPDRLRGLRPAGRLEGRPRSCCRRSSVACWPSSRPPRTCPRGDVPGLRRRIATACRRRHPFRLKPFLRPRRRRPLP